MADALERLAPASRSQIAMRLGITEPELASLGSADVLLRLMRERLGRTSTGAAPREPQRPAISLDKAWHGVHYLLSGLPEPGASLESQAVLGGTDIGDDDEGFSGYGPARYLTAQQVAAIAAALAPPRTRGGSGRALRRRTHVSPRHLSRLDGVRRGLGARRTPQPAGLLRRCGRPRARDHHLPGVTRSCARCSSLIVSSLGRLSGLAEPRLAMANLRTVMGPPGHSQVSLEMNSYAHNHWVKRYRDWKEDA